MFYERCQQYRRGEDGKRFKCNSPLPDDEISREMGICYSCEQRQVGHARERAEWSYYHSEASPPAIASRPRGIRPDTEESDEPSSPAIASEKEPAHD